MSDTAVNPSKHRRDVNKDFQQLIAVNFCHPYNRKFNETLYKFARFLPHVNICNIDEDLARLYLLSTNQEEKCPKEFLGTGMGVLRVWLYSSICNWLTTMISTFDRSRMIDDKYYEYSHTSYSEQDSLGYTIKLSSSLKLHLQELIQMVERGKSECPVFLQKLQYKLEVTKMALCAAYQRHEKITGEYLYSRNPEDVQTPHGETMLVKDIVVPLLSFIDISPIVPEETTKFYDEMERRYCPCKLKIYGMILEVLSGLRSTWSERTHFNPEICDPYGYTIPDPANTKSLTTEWDAWIDHLPSYRPEFVISLVCAKQFSNLAQQDDACRYTETSVEFLRSLQMFKGYNY